MEPSNIISYEDYGTPEVNIRVFTFNIDNKIHKAYCQIEPSPTISFARYSFVSDFNMDINMIAVTFEELDLDQLYIITDDNGNYLLDIGPYFRYLHDYSKKDEAYKFFIQTFKSKNISNPERYLPDDLS